MANEKNQTAASSQTVLLVVGWVWVGVPLAWGVYQTLLKAFALFN